MAKIGTQRSAGKQRKRTFRTRKSGDGAKTGLKAIPVMTVMKRADKKGRIVLGGRFANRAVIIERVSETEVVVKLARVIPETESWLYENPLALAAVRTGLAQARASGVTQGPDMKSDAKLVAELED